MGDGSVLPSPTSRTRSLEHPQCLPYSRPVSLLVPPSAAALLVSRAACIGAGALAMLAYQRLRAAQRARRRNEITAERERIEGEERRHAEHQRRASEERFKLVAENSGSMIYDVDVATGTIYRSEALSSVFGWDTSDDTEEWWTSRIHPEDRERVATQFGGLAQESGSPDRWSAEYRFRKGDGSYITVLERGTVVRGADGVPLRYIGTMTDVSDRAELADQLRQAQKMEAVGQLAGGIAHDFNNLLTAISCNVELLLDSIELSDVRRDDVLQIREASSRAATLTRQLLAFSRRQVLQPKALDLNATVSSMERLLRRVISTDFRLHTSLDAAVAPVFADAGQMEQVVMNLVLNARDAMPGGGAIIVSTANVVVSQAVHHRFGVVAPGAYVTLSVKDSGTGIEPHVLERLFEPFFTTKGQGKGTGLGLATVHGIVLQSEGQIVVDSALGRGTEFTVYLPVHDALPPRAAVARARHAEPPAVRTVLVVDDETPVRDVAMRAIARAGYRVLGAASGADAIALLEREGDTGNLLLLTDMMMPDMNGLALIELANLRFPAVRVACMSGYTTEEMAREGLAIPLRQLLQKPFSLPGLVSFVTEAFEQASPAER